MSGAAFTLAEAKARAQALRRTRAEAGAPISQAAALELVARAEGHRDWNALHAAIRDRPPPRWETGGRVTGRYLSRPFAATVLDCTSLGRGWFRLSLALDTPVDVVRSDRFSNLRSRLRCTLGPAGHSRERTSDGAPQVVLDGGDGAG